MKAEREPVTSPCRLYTYLAAEAPLAVVLRRGPTAWVRLSLWHTETDTFEHGQWFQGRVYPRRCDVSPDGALFAYFAHKVSGSKDLNTDSWIAISRPPYFTALAVWAEGGTYCAGGFFRDRHSLFLSGIREAPDQGEMPPCLQFTSDIPHRDRTPDWTDRTVFFSRLLRDGWTPDPYIDHPSPNWERLAPDGRTKLILMPVQNPSFERYGGYYAQEYALQRGEDLHPLGEATWADWDQHGRLVMAQNGCLWKVDEPTGNLRLIADFNGQTPDPQPAPDWAQQWPRW